MSPLKATPSLMTVMTSHSWEESNCHLVSASFLSDVEERDIPGMEKDNLAWKVLVGSGKRHLLELGFAEISGGNCCNGV